MFKNIKWLRLTPDRPGRGGSKTGIHSFQQEPINDVRSLEGAHVYRGAWRRDFATANYPTTQFSLAAPASPYALHGYVYPSLTDPSATPSVSILLHALSVGAGANYVINVGTGATPGGPYISSNTSPGVFQNIGGRCFFGEGSAEGRIFDDRSPAIHAQLAQNIGIATPGQALQPSSALTFNASAISTEIIPNLTGYGLGYIFNSHGSAAATRSLNTPNQDSPIGTILISDTVTLAFVDASYAAISGTLPVAGVPSVAGISSNTSPSSVPFNVGTNTISCTSGASVVTRSGLGWPTGFGRMAGLAINFNGRSFMLGATDQDQPGDQFDINGNLVVLGANQAIIYGVYDGPSVTNIAFTITGCQVQLAGTNSVGVVNGGTLGYGQSTASSVVPVLVSARSSTDLWFTESAVGANKIGRITTALVVTEFTIPTGNAGATGIASGPDGNLWFTEATQGKIGRIDPISKTFTEFTTPSGGAGAPSNITAAADGNMWFTEPGVSKVGRITPAGIITEFPAPAASVPTDIVAGPDGNVWCADNTGGVGSILRVTVTGSGIGTIVSATSGLTGSPTSIAVGPDGNLWFTEPVVNKIGRMTTAFAVTEFTVTTAAAGVTDITAGPDGNLWFTEANINKIGRITPAGVITEFAGPTGAPTSITSNGDGALWFTEQAASKIGRITTAGTVTSETATTTGAAAPIDIVGGGSVRNLGNIMLSGTGNPISPAPWAGPTYSYAWYDPETGHMSNIAPLMTIASAPLTPPTTNVKDYRNVTPYFRIDPGFIAYPEGAPLGPLDGNRFSHVMFFRTLSAPGSSTLYPIGSLNPYVAKVHPGAASTRGSWNPAPLHGWFGQPNAWVDGRVAGASPNYFFDFSSDSDLLLSGGFRAPQFTNEKPMVLLRGGVTQAGNPYAMAYWDRRLWIVNTQEPNKVAFSADDAQCPLGVPEESFPPTNFLRLPSKDDIRVTGMRTVGDMLLITTEHIAYIIAGNNESNYRLLKVSSSMPGVGTYQMDEFPTYTGAEGEPTTMFYLGRDRIVYQWTIGGPVVPISQPIQDQLDAVLSGLNGGFFTPLVEYQNSRVHCVSAWGRRLVVVAPNGMVETPSLGPSQVHIYDIANQVWSKGFHTISAGSINGLAPMATVYGLDVPVNELFAITDPATNTIKVRSWLRDDTSGTQNLMDIITFPMNFDGKKTRKQIVSVNLHATAGQWALGLYVNEATVPISATFAAYPDPIGSIYALAATPVDPGAQDIVVMAAAFSNLAPVVGYRFVFDIQKNEDSNPAKVYAIDIGFVEYEQEGDGEP